MSSLYWDTSAPYLVPSIVSMTKRDPLELIHIVFGFCDGIEFRLTMTDKEIECPNLRLHNLRSMTSKFCYSSDQSRSTVGYLHL